MTKWPFGILIWCYPKELRSHDQILMELLTYNSNLLAEKAYTKIGFKKIECTTSSHEEIKHFYPSDGMTRWQKITEHGN